MYRNVGFIEEEKMRVRKGEMMFHRLKIYIQDRNVAELIPRKWEETSRNLK